MARRPTIDLAKLAAEARARADDFATRGPRRMGEVLNIPEGFEARWFVPDELRSGRADKLRRELSERGAFQAPEGSEVAVNGVGNAEIWLVPNDVAAQWKARRAARDAQERQRLGVR